MLVYTDRFMALANIIHNLHAKYKADQDEGWLGQIANLCYRVYLIRNMQILGVLSLLFCALSMFALFAGSRVGGQWGFAIALILMIVSPALSLREFQVSVGAMNLLLMEL